MDRVVVQYAHSLVGRSPFFDGVAVFFAAYLPYCIAVVFIALLFARGTFGADAVLTRKKKRLQFLLGTALSLCVALGIIAPAIHYAYARARPFAAFGWTPRIAHTANPSFPSDHAVFLFVLAASVWQINRKWGQWLAAAAALNAIARVYVLVHFPTDVIVGALIGVGVVFAVQRIIRFA